MSFFDTNNVGRLFRNLKALLRVEGGTPQGAVSGTGDEELTPGPQESEDERRRYGLHLSTGDRHYRAWVGPPEDYDLISALQVSLLLAAGLRETHRLADVGCGSLRAGRMLIPYLRPGHYYGIEPERWLVEEGIDKELGRDILEIKQPQFRFVPDFSLEAFQTQFDFVIAQSVFSHTHPDLLLTGFGKIAAALAPEGKLLATWAEGKRRSNKEGSGWIYKGVRRYAWEEIEEFAQESGLHVKRLAWTHPRQSWFVAGKVGSEAAVDGLSRELRSPRPSWGEKSKSRSQQRAKEDVR